MSPTRLQPAPPPSPRPLLLGGIIAFAGVIGYANTLSAPFFFDDIQAIVKNPSIRHLWPIGDVLMPHVAASAGVAGRPLVNLSCALNYAFGGLNVQGYHALNLAIHVLAGLTLFGILRRTVHRFGDGFAFAVALLWTVHPLQTESVTCIIQRTESMMGLFYLLTVYCFIRYAESTRSETLARSATSDPGSGTRQRFGTMWAVLSIAACLFGMATKEVMISAPLMAFLYDRTFIAGTFAAAWKQRRSFYLGLAATWLLLAFLVIHQGGSRGAAAGFGQGVSPWHYALTQGWAIVHYLRLSFWPHPLIVDYGSDVVSTLAAVAPQAALLVVLAGATGWLFFRPGHGRPAAYAGLWFFAILAPSSSFIPLVAQTVAEHRMYLPLAAVLSLAVALLFRLLGRAGLPIALLLAVGAEAMTIRRNRDYGSELAICRDTVAHRPSNARAQNNLGIALTKAGQPAEAMACYREALRLNPDSFDAHRNLGDALAAQGDSAGAIAEYQLGVRLQPGSAETQNNLGIALAKAGRLSEAVRVLQTVLRLEAGYPGAELNLALAENDYASALRRAGDLPGAVTHYEAAVRLKPDFAEAYNNLGATLANQRRFAEAIPAFEAAVRLRPDYPEAARNLQRARTLLR